MNRNRQAIATRLDAYMYQRASGRPVTSTLQTPASIAERIAELERQLAKLRREQQTELLYAIASVVGHRAFAAAELWRHVQRLHPHISQAFAEVRITSIRRLGKHLERLQTLDVSGIRLERIGHDKAGVVWMVNVLADSHLAHCNADPAGI